MAYLMVKIYDNPAANPDVDPPLNYRLNSLPFWKKAWSYFMVNRNMPWDEVTMCENPTRCTMMADLIKSIKKTETRRARRPSQARRALLPQEYEHAIGLMGKHPDNEVTAWLFAINCFQYNLIARHDNTAKLCSPDLQPFHQFPSYGITVRLCWSKNVMEERDAPKQILLDAMDWRYCELSHLGVWLEYNYDVSPPDNDYYFGMHGQDNAESIKNQCQQSFEDSLPAWYFQPCCQKQDRDPQSSQVCC